VVIDNFAIGDIDVPGRLSIGELAQRADDEGVAGVHLFSFGFEIGDVLGAFLFDGEIVVDVCIVGVDECEIVDILDCFQRVENGGGV
jgi:hypothetical protein